ncbi:3-deoxy-7-phosphoheptulonate synthase [Neomoorella thermoacetica]|uniref:3-deoxy-7-phosphoheptulonate synthase n=1 Tax=Neomoorella thermoacetica TaxID=1525 RepID=UPI0008FA7EBC|nr:3-deoxy-7-phosphoheptulonate synthase [Moorella thermoacetica]OIQ13017.1 phospho-2-dehydro-3-deoxyheptonate aldolase [Moorella thermoacetica]OIQ61302.1 phospho-2-dehydro-3-deoxyheptonate aldolase [Moorella thermoacetica]
MIIVMQPGATREEEQRVISHLEREGFKVHLSRGIERTIIGVIGDKTRLKAETVTALAGVEKVVPILQPYKLASRDFHPEDTVVETGNRTIGGAAVQIIAGPCAVESRDQLLEAADAVREAGATMLRGGAYKPRSSPYSFQGLAAKGLEILAEARERTGLPVVTEVMDQNLVEDVAAVADVLQIGSRNMQNFALLQAVGQTNKPVLLKRGLAATIEEWLLAAEYILNAGNSRVILCERGIRTFETYTRNTLDLSAVPAVKHLSHLPVIVDPSHGTGRRFMVAPMARAALAAGADGIMVEVHPRPQEALSDGSQSLDPEQFAALVREIRPIITASGRELERQVV